VSEIIRPIESAVDFGKTAGDYARHRAGFPPVLFERLAALGVGGPGQRTLDLGTGTGTLARGLALRGARVIGLDPARSMLVEGRRLGGDAGAPVVARAEALPFADASLDVVAAGQCWHWFDRPRAAAEVRRVLVRGGALAICHYDWVPLPGNVLEATEALIRAHNPAWTGHDGTGLHPRWLADCALAGLEGLETFSTDVPAVYSHAGWRGRIRASAGVAASLPPARVEAFDRELAALLAARFPSDPLVVPHRVFAVVARAPR
jgi:SAM-dependent methyltransferase